MEIARIIENSALSMTRPSKKDQKFRKSGLGFSGENDISKAMMDGFPNEFPESP